MSVKLFSTFNSRSITVKNRVVVSPMCQYSASEGYSNDWHMVQYGRFALSGAGLVFVEATAVEKEGRITYGDLGLWDDAHVASLKRITDFLKAQGVVPGIQLSHAGRRASAQRPWHGAGPLGDEDKRLRQETPWPTVGPSPLAANPSWPQPRELDAKDLEQIKTAFVAAAERALRAKFEVLEVHCAHGYLLHQFLSPLSNMRSDAYGGDMESRCRFPLEVCQKIREIWPKDKPMFVRVSAVDGIDGGLTLAATVFFSRQLKEIGVDLIDCSSGGIARPAVANATVAPTYGYQVGFAEAIRREADIPTMAVGLIVDPHQAEAVLQQEQADLVAFAREILANPNWPLMAQAELDGAADYSAWPTQIGWWLENRALRLGRHGTK